MPWVAAKIGYSGLLLDLEKKAWVALGGAVRTRVDTPMETSSIK